MQEKGSFIVRLYLPCHVIMQAAYKDACMGMLQAERDYLRWPHPSAGRFRIRYFVVLDIDLYRYSEVICLHLCLCSLFEASRQKIGDNGCDFVCLLSQI